MCKLFHNTNPKYVPLAYLCNKLVLAHISWHEKYLKSLYHNITKKHEWKAKDSKEVINLNCLKPFG